MAGMTDYLEGKIRGHVLLGEAYTQPVAVYLALFSDATGDDGTGTEATRRMRPSWCRRSAGSRDR